MLSHILNYDKELYIKAIKKVISKGKMLIKEDLPANSKQRENLKKISCIIKI